MCIHAYSCMVLTDHDQGQGTNIYVEVIWFNFLLGCFSPSQAVISSLSSERGLTISSLMESTSLEDCGQCWPLAISQYNTMESL